MERTMIDVRELTKRYGQTTAVDRLSLVGPRAGEIFGFLGPNGAGKTTTIRMMMGLLAAERRQRRSWAATTCTREPLRAKALCGFVPDRPHVYEKLTGAEFLDFTADLYAASTPTPRSRAASACSSCSICAEWRRRAAPESYSHGMKQRLVMAAALMHAPRILIVRRADRGHGPARRAAAQAHLPRPRRRRRHGVHVDAQPRGRRGALRPRSASSSAAV